jgi:hypothetical protein
MPSGHQLVGNADLRLRLKLVLGMSGVGTVSVAGWGLREGKERRAQIVDGNGN